MTKNKRVLKLTKRALIIFIVALTVLGTVACSPPPIQSGILEDDYVIDIEGNITFTISNESGTAAEAAAPVEPEALVEEALYPESLPAEATAPEAPVEEAPAPEANPTVEAVAEAITSSADAAAEASRAAALLTEALAPAQPEEAPAAEPELTDEELAQYSQAAYDEALKALQIQQ